MDGSDITFTFDYFDALENEYLFYGLVNWDGEDWYGLIATDNKGNLTEIDFISEQTTFSTYNLDDNDNNINQQKGEVLISNIDFTNNTTQSNSASAFASRGNEVRTYFDNVKVQNSNLGVDPRGVLYFWQTRGGVFNNAQIFGNDGIIFNVNGNNMSLSFNNTAIFNNDIKGTTWGGYFRITGSNNILDFTNSTVSGNNMVNQD